MSSRIGDLMVLSTIKTEAQEGRFMALGVRKECVRNNFKGIHNHFQKDLSFRDSQLTKLVGLRKNASRWTSWRRKISPIAHQPRSLRDMRKPGLSS